MKLCVMARPQIKPAAALGAAKRAHVVLQTLYIFVLPSARLRRNLIYCCE